MINSCATNFQKKRQNLYLIDENPDPVKKYLAFEESPTMGFFLRFMWQSLVVG